MLIVAALGLNNACCRVNYESTDVEGFAKLISDANVVVLDVRTAEEYTEGHIERAVNIDVKSADFLSTALQQLPKEKTIAVYCRSGRRSATAACKLAEDGYKVVNLTGGIIAWENNGKPIITARVEALPPYVYSGDDPYMGAISAFLIDTIAKNYIHGEVCIPSVTIVHADNSSTDDVKVWGDFWVFNYDLSGDTLKMVSGGSHPGMMHLRASGGGYKVSAFDCVSDGARYLMSAKKIFGKYYGAFNHVSSNIEEREKVRAATISRYVSDNALPVTYYADYGQEPVEISAQ